MAYKSASVGLFTIPTAPSKGTAITSGAADTYSANYVQLIASTASAQYITAVTLSSATATTVPVYCNVQLATGGAGAETVVGQIQCNPDSATATTAVKTSRVDIWPWIPVANAARIAAKVADNLGSIAWNVSLQCIAAANVVVDSNVKEQVDIQTVLASAVTATTAGILDVNAKNINNATAVNGLTAAAIATGVWTDATAGDFTAALSIGKSVMNGVSLGTGLTVARCTLTDTLTTYTGNTVQTGDSFARIGVAGAGLTNIDLPDQTMNITGNVTGNLSGSVGSVTGAVGSVTGAVGSVTGAVGSVTGAVGSVTGAVGSVTGNVSGSVASVVGLTAANLDATVSSRLASASYTAPDNTSITAIKGKTDSLAFTVAGQVDANVKSIKDTTITGAGTAGSPWGP